jgi:hypothetical protein
MMVLDLTCLALAAALGTAPQATTRAPATSVAVDSTPTLLTVDALGRMTNFYTAFMKEPPDIKNTGRKQNQEPLPVSLDLGSGGQMAQRIQRVVNMVAMAAKFPGVATDLKNAGLTAQQWEEYRKALFEATLSVQIAKMNNSAPTPSSTVGQNAAFLDAHQKEFDALKATGMWFPPR